MSEKVKPERSRGPYKTFLDAESDKKVGEQIIWADNGYYLVLRRTHPIAEYYRGEIY